MKPIRVHWLQHAEHEGLGCIEPWLQQRGYAVSATRWQRGERGPAADSFDWLVVMGGPMNIYEYEAHPWLREEQALIHDAVVNKKQVLGICLGAQLLANALGGTVTRNKEVEIGFFDVRLKSEAIRSPLFRLWPTRFPAFHWHGDTFAIPAGATHLMSSEACANQAFMAEGGRLVGLQFHLEVRPDEARQWLAEDPPAPGRFVQTPAAMLRAPTLFAQNNHLMLSLLDAMAAQLGDHR